MVTLKDVSNFLKTFDLFGETFTFKSRKRKTYNSLMGGVTSFIFIIYTIYYLVFNLSDLLKKNSRKTQISTNYLSHNSINLNEHKDFIFFICLRNKNMNTDDFLSENLKIDGNFINQHKKNSNFTTNKTSLNFDSCEPIFRFLPPPGAERYILSAADPGFETIMEYFSMASFKDKLSTLGTFGSINPPLSSSAIIPKIPPARLTSCM